MPTRSQDAQSVARAGKQGNPPRPSPSMAAGEVESGWSSRVNLGVLPDVDGLTGGYSQNTVTFTFSLSPC